jgi:hypothetical protein
MLALFVLTGNAREMEAHFLSTGEDAAAFIKSKVDSNGVSRIDSRKSAMNVNIILCSGSHSFILFVPFLLQEGHGFCQKLWSSQPANKRSLEEIAKLRQGAG